MKFVQLVLLAALALAMPSCTSFQTFTDYYCQDDLPLYSETGRRYVGTIPSGRHFYIVKRSASGKKYKISYQTKNYKVMVKEAPLLYTYSEWAARQQYLKLAVPENPTLSRRSSSPTSYSSGYRGSSSRYIHTGPRGGRYYINSHGNKTYIRRK